MKRLSVDDFHPEVISLFTRYMHGDIDRRGFLNRVGRYTTGGITATMLLDLLNPRFAAAQQVAPDDKRIVGKRVEYPAPEGSGKMGGYLVRPANAATRLPGVLIVHENRGLNPHIEDIARRVALENYLAFAPDGLFPYGGYPGDEDKARELFAKADKPKMRTDFIAGAGFLRALPECAGKIGEVGFCFGGGLANFLATRISELDAAAIFYGAVPAAADVSKIKAPMLLHYAANDDNVNPGWPGFETALRESNISYKAYIYPNTQHAFFNDTTPRYNEAAAKLAWERTLAFFVQHLRG